MRKDCYENYLDNLYRHCQHKLPELAHLIFCYCNGSHFDPGGLFVRNIYVTDFAQAVLGLDVLVCFVYFSKNASPITPHACVPLCRARRIATSGYGSPSYAPPVTPMAPKTTPRYVCSVGLCFSERASVEKCHVVKACTCFGAVESDSMN